MPELSAGQSLLRGLFPAPEVIQHKYNLPSDTRATPYYSIRLKDLLAKHGTKARRLILQGETLHLPASRETALREWLFSVRG